MKPRTLVVGGSYNKPSSIIDQIYSLFENADVYNGIRPLSISGYDLVLWMPDISNTKPKDYPVKDVGSVLICSKVLRDNRTEVDGVKRIFDIHGNAVITINKDNPKKFSFKLIDALSNTWIETDDIVKLVKTIYRFYQWSNGQIRKSYTRSTMVEDFLPPPKEFIDLNTQLADKIENSMGSRYFGNFSTRCMSLFPSTRLMKNCYYFSPRNTDKRRLTVDDFVLVNPPYYRGDRKPSVDTPVQVEIFKEFEDINFMIHGHAFVDGEITTNNYYPCGDMREVDEIIEVFSKGHRFTNLKNHGFLLAATDLMVLKYTIKNYDFKIMNMLR